MAVFSVLAAALMYHVDVTSAQSCAAYFFGDTPTGPLDTCTVTGTSGTYVSYMTSCNSEDVPVTYTYSGDSCSGDAVSEVTLSLYTAMCDEDACSVAISQLNTADADGSCDDDTTYVQTAYVLDLCYENGSGSAVTRCDEDEGLTLYAYSTTDCSGSVTVESVVIDATLDCYTVTCSSGSSGGSSAASTPVALLGLAMAAIGAIVA